MIDSLATLAKDRTFPGQTGIFQPAEKYGQNFSPRAKNFGLYY